MIRTILTASLLLLALTGGAAIAEDSQIGLFTNEYADACGRDLATYTQTSIYVIARLGSDLSALSAAEFGFENLPGGGGGQMNTHWESGLVIGNLSDGIAVAFMDMQNGPDVVLGRIDFFATSESWVGDNYRFSVGPSPSSGKLVLVDDSFNEQDEVYGGRFTFNCANDQDCACGRDGATTASWGEVKSLFH